MVEKQDSYQKDSDWRSEEKNKLFTCDSSWEKKELEKEWDIAKMIHKEVTGHDKKEMKSHNDELPSRKLSREADVCSESGLANKSRFVIQLTENEDLSQDKSQSKAVDAVAPGSLQMKGQTSSTSRKKRRPQSLNLGLPPELSYQKGDSDSEEENESSASDSSPGENLATTGNPFQLSDVVLIKDEPGSEENQACRIHKGSRQEELLSAEDRYVSAQRMEQAKRNKSHMESTDHDLDSVNGPEKTIHDGSSAGIKGESVVRVRGKGLIDNKELAEVKLRQVRTHERRISSSGGEDMEGFMGDRVQKSSFLRLSGTTYQSEITKIVPLKPERTKSMACKDEKDRTGTDELAQAFRREYRWSVGSPEGHSDLNWADVPMFHPGFAADLEGNAKAELHDDSYQSGRGPTESQWVSSKGSGLPKMAPPAPPVKTQKARESGLILRNSRNAGRDPSLEAAKKRHSVTARLLLFHHWKIKHRMSSRAISVFSPCVFSDLKTVIRHTCLKRESHVFAPPFGQNSFQRLHIFPNGKSARLIPQKQKRNINMAHSG